MKRLLRVPFALILSLGFLVLAVALPAPQVAETSQFDSDVIGHALRSTVRIVMPIDGKQGYYNTGSGSLVNAQGLILTNFHVIADMDSGNMMNEKGLVYLYITTSAKAAPRPMFIGQVIQGSKELDLALVQVIANIDGSKLSGELNLPYYQLGSVNDIDAGHTLGVIGYPGIGRGTISWAQGDVSGFTFFENGSIEWIKTEALIAGGNSGGSAIDLRGRLIGVPTETMTDKGGAGTMGYVRPVDLVPWFGRHQDPDPKEEGVVYKGQLVDAHTGRGIEGAYFAFFPSGTQLSDSDAQVLSVGYADSGGYFETKPPVPGGKTYALLIGAKGYKPIFVEYETQTGAAVREFQKPLALQRR